MTPPSHRMVENRKYMWDGAVYPTAEEAGRVAETYRRSRFDVQTFEERGAYLLYTRREVAAQ